MSAYMVSSPDNMIISHANILFIYLGVISNFMAPLQSDNSNWLSFNLKKIAKPNSCTYICNRLVSQT